MFVRHVKTLFKGSAVAASGAAIFSACSVFAEEKAVCPVKHDASPAPVCPVRQETAGTCPVNHTPSDNGNTGSHGSSFLTNFKSRSEPSNDTADRYVKRSSATEQQQQDLDYDKHRIAHADDVPGGLIPALGRGNSDDGAHWVNPTPAELFRALRRNKKIIDEEDAYSVAFIHSAVVDSTWEMINEFEELHPECETVTLKRFEGKYGQHSIKSWITDKIFDVKPFDRHDWYVDRDGTEVRYIIDYYSVPAQDGSDEYIFDVRPDMTSFDNIKDRITMAYRRYKRGDSVW